MGHQTAKQYKTALAQTREVFINKNKDYGTSWRILRVASLVDQIFIKAKRIRSIEEKKAQKVADDKKSEYIGIINYAVLSLIQLRLPGEAPLEMPFEDVLAYYDSITEEAFELMEQKNHDYGEVWREMWISSYTDIILMKLLRLGKIIENDGKTIASEGLEANFFDIINYSIFALIKIQEHYESSNNVD